MPPVTGIAMESLSLSVFVADELPVLAEGTYLDFEAPCSAILMRQEPSRLRQPCGVHEEIVLLVRHRLPRSGKIDHAVHYQQPDMDSRWPKRASHRFSQAALRGLGRRERRRPLSAPKRGRRPGEKYGA